VHVEAEWDRADPVGETRWLAELRAATGLPTVAVGHAGFDRDDVAEVLAAHAAFPFMRGIRYKPAAEAEASDFVRGQPGSMDDPRWRAGYALLGEHRLSLDLQTPRWHLPAAAELARDFPHTRIMVNHTGLPADRSADGLAAWRAALAGVAARAGDPGRHRDLRRRPLLLCQQFPRRQPGGQLRYHLFRLQVGDARPAARRPAQALP
jgi:predicted TIM-barrel fold metal-dependent hydrolase